MRLLVAPDKFRGTATAPEVCAAVAAAAPAGAEVVAQPMSDGGEGVLEAFGGPNRRLSVTGPLGSPVEVGWRLVGDLAVVESAAACGLLVAGGAEANDPVAASTRGVGELLVAARQAGAVRVLLGVGGSASTDGGAGALAALDAAGLTASGVQVCCDVATRFLDAARVFGPQKGADPGTVQQLSDRLARLREEYAGRFGVDVAETPGSGAAGGLAGGLAAAGAQLVPGFDRVAAEVGLAGQVARADLVVTGEGRLDVTSLAGKVVGGVVALARTAGVPVLVVAGAVEAAARAELVGAGADVTVLSLVELVGLDRALSDTQAALTEVVRAHLS
jgi:glycerate kinase